MSEFKAFSFKGVKATYPVVYGVVDKRDASKVVYVGKTTNPKKRFENYRYWRSCHNALLRVWLEEVGDNAGVVFLEENPKDLDESERTHIDVRRSTLFNLDKGGSHSWRKNKDFPWIAGPGIKCPSDLVTIRLRNRGHDVSNTRHVIRSMNLRDRCLFEVNLCMDLFYQHHGFKDKLEKWLDITDEKLVNALEAVY